MSKQTSVEAKRSKPARKPKAASRKPKPLPERGPKLTAATADKHHLYEAAVQCVEADVEFFQRLFKKETGRPLRTMKEDFSGTSGLICDFVRRHKDNYGWGVDLHGPTLAWGKKHHVSRLGDAAERVTLIQDNVLNVTSPKVDMVCALNFSYQVFKERAQLIEYMKQARASLNPDGIFVLDAFGGTEAFDTMDEDRKIPASITPQGGRMAAFTYEWEQAKFNVITHEILCHIHFKFRDGTRMQKAFTYDWRLYTLPELRDMLLEAGFSRADAYMEGWDDEEETANGIFRKRKAFDNMAGWVGYMVGIR